MRTASPSLRASTAPVVRAWRTARLLAGASCASLTFAACGGSDGGDGGTGTTPAISLSVASNTLTVAQGGAAGTVAATVGRSGGFAGEVALSGTATGGLTVQVTPNTLGAAETSASVGISAPSSTAAGTYQVTVRATGTGVTERTQTITVTVTGSGGGNPTNVPFAFCAARVPTWVAYQSEAGPWTRSTSTNATFTMPITGRGGVAFVLPSSSGSGFETHVYYGTAAELETMGAGICSATEVGSKEVIGTVSNIGPTAADDATILFGGTGNRVLGNAAPPKSFSLQDVLDGPRDLLAVQKGPGTPIRPVLKLIVRRGLNPANGSALATLDFAATEAFAPASASLTVGNLGSGEEVLVRTSFITDKGFLGSLPFDITDPEPTATQNYFGLPANQVQTGDLQVVSASTTSSAAREAIGFFTDIVNRTLTLGPAMSSATIGVAATTPYVRPRAQFAAQTEYGAGAIARFQQTPSATARYVVLVVATAASTANASNQWTLALPDFTASAGYDANWAPRPGTIVSGTATVFGDRLLLPNRRQVLPGGTPAAGMTFRDASRAADFTP